MNKVKNSKEIHSLVKSLTPKQKELIRLLQNKETLITKKHVCITTGNGAYKKINESTFYKLVNKGLIVNHSESPSDYILSDIGEKIEIK